MLHGRREELALLDELLEGARNGRAGVLVIRGDAGIGKSALLECVAAGADDMRVLWATGVESESELPFAGLHQLLRPVLDRVDRLPAAQAAALRAAIGIDGGTAERFLVSVAVLGLLAEIAEERPLLALVDDAQWLDRASAEALVFAARRLDADDAALLFAVRDGEQTFPGTGLPQLALGGVNGAAAAALIDERGGRELVAGVAPARDRRGGRQSLGVDRAAARAERHRRRCAAGWLLAASAQRGVAARVSGARVQPAAAGADPDAPRRLRREP